MSLPRAANCAKPSRVVDKAWDAQPHPDLAQVFADLRFGDAARDRLKRIEALAKKVPGHIEGALALARAALDAQEFAKARAALAPYLAAPTKRVAVLMAELERAEHNDEGRAREWIARALNAAPDPTWTAEGHMSDRWLPVSPERPDRRLRMARAVDRNRERAGDRGRAAERRHAHCDRAEPKREKAAPAAASKSLAPRAVEASATKPDAGSQAEPKPEPIIPLVMRPTIRAPTRSRRHEPASNARRRLAQDFRIKPLASLSHRLANAHLACIPRMNYSA